MAAILRQTVAPGGVYDLPKVSYSDSTKLLIKELVRESAVSTQHQRQIERWVAGGRALPPHRALTAPSQQAQPRPSSPAATPRPNIQSKRSHDAIRKMGLYEPNTHYVPPPPKYGPGSKERCQELMAYGREGAMLNTVPVRRDLEIDTTPSTDRFSELVREMEERVEWLEAMDAVGAGEKYHNLIASQLALKLRDLELLDQERSRALARAERQAAILKENDDEVKGTNRKI